MFPSLRQFLLIIIVGMTLLLLALLYFHTRLNQDSLQYHLDTHNNNLATVLRNALMADGLEAELVGGAEQFSAAMHAKISSTLENQLRSVPVLKVKIYSLDAMVLFSSKDSEIGENAKENKGVRSALGGVSLSSLVEPHELNEFDNVIELRHVHQQYIPITSQQTGDIIGIFEIYADISKIVENVDSKQKTMFWSMTGILVVFYLALAASFLGIVKLLRNEKSQRQAHLDDLQAIHDDLERRVEERTAELDHSKQFLQAIMDNVPDAILTCDSDCVIQSINSSAIRLFDGKESDLIGRNLKSLFASDSDVNILKPEISVQKEVMLKRIDEAEFPADLWIGPLELVDQTSSYVVVVHDITSRTQAQRELEATRQQYFHQEKMAAIGQLAAGILHEVGNPIAAIAGATSELKNLYTGKDLAVESYSIDDAVSNNIEVIDEQTTRLAKITREIADFASPKPREREMLDLNGLLRSTTRVLAYDQRFRSIELDLQLDKNLPAIIGVADQLTQVFMNLLINAMDACSSISGDKDRIILKSQLDGDRVHVYVKDNGHGMPKETLGHVLEPFYTTKAVGKGSGLGLSLCETIVLAHGGVLDINTKEGKGTTVHVFLPIDLTNQESDKHKTDDNKEEL